jgi:MFS family permease
MRFNFDYLPAIGLGVTQIMGYGTLMYAYAVLLPHMAIELGLNLSQIFGVLSAGLLFGGLFSPLSGSLTDRFRGRWIMVGGSLVAGLALISMGQVTNWQQLLVTIIAAS